MGRSYGPLRWIGDLTWAIVCFPAIAHTADLVRQVVNTMKTLVIGIGGITNGGKTTLARRLKEQLKNCTIISQDNFFKSQSEVAVDEHGFLQYDVLDALHMKEMVASIHTWIANPEGCALPGQSSNIHNKQKETDCCILIVEGFLLYNYRPLSDIWNKKYFLTIPYEECKKRRSTRIYNPPDPPGYFDGHVWPMYLKHKREMEENGTDIVYLDGTKLQDDLCSRICSDIAQELQKTS
ncbi:nicotinamide riboside kinase 1 isoform X2 [Sphaerodactylus townsendi]|uniref:nicotinamide riboside kinase 1 isoform X2 n=1 Tax=Sphaerodactylus townsendi TaxID=933632 RepID=UPI0020274E9F|nr:nicotinamide riboside kinase 1 isoform X2 [Sphaerodactylus townsendi]